jgi:type I restriction enzyme S subunit
VYGTSKKSSSNGEIPVLRMGNINRCGKIDWNNLVYTSDKDDITKYSLQTNDLLFNRTNSNEWVGKTAIYKGEKTAIYAGYIVRLRVIILDADYVNFVMNSSYYRGWCNDVKTDAVNQSNINAQKLSHFFIPIPPLNEQKRIVNELSSWLNIIEAINKEKSDLQSTICLAKSKILDLAIHGKLVPQDPNDEPASELLKRINPKAEITCDNPQYGKLPSGWCLTEGKYLYKPMKSAKPKGLAFNYIDIDSIDNTKQRIDSVKVVKTENAPSRASRYTQKGDIVFSMVRPYLKNIAMIPDNDCIASTGFYVCSPSDVAVDKYCYYLMISDYTVNGLNQYMKGDNSPSINKGDIDSWLFPIPPLQEQHRIVAKIEELFAQLDKIEASL